MTFEQFALLIRKQFDFMCSNNNNKLFISSVDGETLWNLYLNSFAPEDNYVFRDPQSNVNNCRKDKHFISTYGNIVTVDENNNIVTMFDVYEDRLEDSCYYNSVVAVRNALKAACIKSVFGIQYDFLNKQPYERCTKNQDKFQLGYQFTNKKYNQQEVDKFGVVNTNDIYTFYHFYCFLPSRFLLDDTVSLATHYNKLNTDHSLFVKGLQIPLETLEVVKELMDQGSLLRADIYKDKLIKFIDIKKEYDQVKGNKLNWTWKKFSIIPFARFANELIGTTCIDLAEGKDINLVCKEFNIRVDPANHMKAKAPITSREKEQQGNKIIELGYGNSFQRRFAVVEDININQRIHTNDSNVNEEKSKAVALFANVKTQGSNTLSRHKKNEFKDIQEVSIENFLENILPNSSSVEVFLESAFESNLVTLTTAIDPSCKNPFKWGEEARHFSWSYKGDLSAKSFIKEAVKDKGGNVEGVLRCSLVWNETKLDSSDLDLWCDQADSTKIGYSTSYRKDKSNKFSSCGGQLDIDIIDPKGNLAVENIYFKSLDLLKPGVYKFYVNPYRSSNSKGFKAEIEFDGSLFTYEYNKPVTNVIYIASVTVNKDKSFTISHYLDPIQSELKSKNMWGLDSNKFHKVNLICLSPNYWGDNAVGNKQYFFLLDKCHSTEPMRSFHIDNLNSELLECRRLLEMFAMSDKLEPTNKQLAGVGFTDDSKESLIVKLKGKFSRTVKIKF